jgi:hypothetical protein
MRRRLLLILLFVLTPLCASAQDDKFIFEMPDDFSDIDTLPPPTKYKSLHMIGLQYGINNSGVIVTPKLDQENIWTFNTMGIYYTYFHALWDHLYNFGLQVGVKYGKQGYTTPYEVYGETCKVIEMPVLSKFKIDFAHERLRLLINLGPFVGYRLATDKEEGFDKYDQRFAYGIMGGVGLAVVFKPLELHIEGSYQYSLGSMYHANKYSDIYWMYAYPSIISITASLHVHLW